MFQLTNHGIEESQESQGNEILYEGEKAKEYFAEGYFTKSQMEDDLTKDRRNSIDYD